MISVPNEGVTRAGDLSELESYVGYRLMMLREANNVSSDELASHLNISSGQLDQIEQGLIPISLPLLYNASNALGVKIDFFFSGLDEPQNTPQQVIPNSHAEILIKIKGASQLLTAFANISRPEHRQRVLEMIELIS